MRDIKLKDNLRYKYIKVLSETKKLGTIGNAWFDEYKSLDNFDDFNQNVLSLENLFSGFSPLNSYSLAILVSTIYDWWFYNYW